MKFRCKLLLMLSDKIATASFDKTAKLWSALTGLCLRTYHGHRAEVVATDFSPGINEYLATASIDRSAKVFKVETGQTMNSFTNHGAEVIAARFHRHGDTLLTGSFDGNAYLWDLRIQQLVMENAIKKSTYFIRSYFSIAFKCYVAP